MKTIVAVVLMTWTGIFAGAFSVYYKNEGLATLLSSCAFLLNFVIMYFHETRKETKK